jgi:hypothetical protein
MKTYGKVHVYIHISLTTALVGCEWSTSRSGRFTHGTLCVGSWVNPSTTLNDVKRRKILPLPQIGFWPLGHPASRQSLYILGAGIAQSGYGRRPVFDFLQCKMFLHGAKTDTGAHQVSYPMGAGIMRQVHEADHPLPSSAEVQKRGAIPPLLHTSSWHSL